MNPWAMLLLGVVAGAIAGYLLARAGRTPAAGASDADLNAFRQQAEQVVRGELAQGRKESADADAQLRREVNLTLGGANATVLGGVEKLRTTVEDRVNAIAGDARRDAQELRRDSVQTIGTMSQEVKGHLVDLKNAVDTLTQQNEQRMERIRETVDIRLAEMQRDNAAKLEQVRATVEEKLQSTLEQRLGESFRLVSERLEAVHHGLGEMQTLASGVGDLKRVLSNVKTRGTWGEVQLQNLLEQMLTQEQYGAQVEVKPGSGERVDFAIKLPGRDADGAAVWLPIDANFPREDYEKLVEAAERGDSEAVDAAGKSLEKAVLAKAKDVREKYIQPPQTTDFGILFLSTEGLYAEVLRRPGLADKIQREQRISLAGPTTLAAILNSFQMGFRTLAIERRSSEVWQVLGAVKAEFSKFGDALLKVQDKLQLASKAIEDAQKRSRAVTRKLRGVEELEEQKTLPGIASVVEDTEETQAEAAGAV